MTAPTMQVEAARDATHTTFNEELFELSYPEYNVSGDTSMLSGAPLWENTWKRFLDVCKSQEMEDYDLESPTLAATRAACAFLTTFMQEQEAAPPDDIYGDGDGGVVMRFSADQRVTEFRIQDDGRIRLLHFEGDDLIVNSLLD